jgi:glycosyltransferase involved in cell wall biosynthesis
LTEVARIMAAADVGVVPKRADGFGNEAFSTKTLEFMACGVPVIVSRTLVDSHYFNDSLVQFFTPGDHVDLARAMVQVYERRGDRVAWSAAARRFAEANSWQERAGDYLRVFDGLAGSDEVAPR